MATVSGAEYIRECPTCGAENAPDVMRCACGAMLAGVDLVRKGMQPAPAQTPAPSDAANLDVVCPFADCGQANPPGSLSCRYCNRPLTRDGEPALGSSPGLMTLPAALKDRYDIVQVLPATGAEAELLIVQPREGEPRRVAKIYRHGIAPKREVMERVARIESAHLVQVLESGTSEGYAYEVMEYCARGSLRERLAAGRLSGPQLLAMIGELAAAIASVHAAGLVHRDLKPGNILVRGEQPLRLVLTDFSIASVLEGTQRFTSAAHTLPYASPESLSGVVDGKSDYWALGMIVLEAALGKHPFAGLSEAVILHHLTTRSVDVGGIEDRNLKKLLRGLLLRDPNARWGQEHLRRWLSGDLSLAEPVDQGPAAGFGEPYRIADHVCATPEQLAVALSRNWAVGVSDLGNGQLLAWFRNVQKDQNVVRLLIEMNFERKLHIDMQLLKLILHLAPGIPPVWRGESIELQAILDRATLALNGDEDAAHWLNVLYRHRVLETYAQAGNPSAADIVQRWNQASDRFDAAWVRQLALIKHKAPGRADDEVVDWDAARFGATGPTRPSLSSLHPRLLAITYDPAWAERLRRRLLAELTGLMVHCPWLAELGDPLRMDGMSLLVLESLLPEAKIATERQTKANARRQEEAAADCRAKASELATIFSDLKTATGGAIPTAAGCRELSEQLGRFFNLAAEIRASGRSDAPWLEMRKSMMRREPIVKRLQALLDQLSERLAVNSGWLNGRMLTVMILATLVGPEFLGPQFYWVLLAIAVGVVAWRLVPNVVLMREVRALSQKL